MGTAYFNAFSDAYIVSEFNEITWQKIGDNSHYGRSSPGKRLAGLNDGLVRFGAGLRLHTGLQSRRILSDSGSDYVSDLKI